MWNFAVQGSMRVDELLCVSFQALYSLSLSPLSSSTLAEKMVDMTIHGRGSGAPIDGDQGAVKRVLDAPAR